MSKKQIQSYVWHGEKCFFVSTIERDCSAAASQDRYNETMVWECDPQTQIRDEHAGFLYQSECGKGNPRTHLEIVESLYWTGGFPPEAA